MDGAVKTERRWVGREVWERRPGVVNAGISVSQARDAGRAAGIDASCAGAVLAGTDAKIESDAATLSKQMLAA